MKVVAIMGALAIVLAATGLAIDLGRGAPQTYALQADEHTFRITGTSTVQTEGAVAGQCVPACTTTTLLDLRLEAPALPGGLHYGLAVGPGAFVFEPDAGAFTAELELDGDQTGETFPLRIVDTERTLLEIQVQPRISAQADAALFAVAGELTVEQIGLVEVSALFEGELLVDAPGTPVAWADGVRLGPLESQGDAWVFDLRVERLVLDDVQEVFITLESDPDATVPGFRLATAAL